MNIKQMLFQDHRGEHVKYCWMIYDADNLDAPPVFSGVGDTEEESIDDCSKAYYFARRDLEE